MVKAENERGASDFAQVTINIIDVNEKPYFVGTTSPGVYEFTMSEVVSVPSYIYAVIARDDDSGLNGEFEYQLISNFQFGNFSIDQYGRIQVLQDPDREFTSSYQFQVIAIDKGNPRLQSDRVSVLIRVLDYNDNRPIFYPNGPIQRTVLEGQNGTEIGAIFANDTDAGINRIVRYIGIYPEGYLAVNRVNGIVSIIKPFDYEQGSHHEFVAIAQDLGSPYLSARKIIKIDVTNRNDENPFFEILDYNITVSEKNSPGSTVLVVAARDKDLGPSGKIITYSISPVALAGSGAGGADDTFVIDNNGLLKLNKPLDFKTKNYYEYTIKAEDGGSPSLSTLQNATIRIYISDVSELQPTFNQNPYIAQVYENISLLTNVVRVTADSLEPKKGPFIYSLVPSNDSSTFTVDATTGMIRNTKPLDYEMQKLYVFEVEVKDNYNSKTGRALVKVYVLDVNDNTPSITSLKFVYNISEGSYPGSVVAKLSGSDNDSGENGRVTFREIGGDGVGTFAIDSNGVITLVGNLDARVKTQYTYVIRAEDHGSPKQTQDTTVVFYVHKTNVPVNTPVFSTHYYRTCVDENIIRTNLLQVNAANSHPIAGSSIVYSLAGNQQERAPFMINDQTGVISLVQPLDYESKASYNFLVNAINNEGRRDIAVVSICVNDLNDNVPVFPISPISVNVSEREQVGFLVYQLTVKDDDLTDFNQTRTFSIVSGNFPRKFAIDNNGKITLADTIDFETIQTPVFNLRVRLQERNDIVETTVTVRITDWNDNHPRFNTINGMYVFNISESKPVGEIIEILTALDNDKTSPNSKITYTLLTTETDFEMRPNALGHGALFVKNPLDYSRQNKYEMVAIATDRGYLGLIGAVLVIINIEDTNNNAPVFEPAMYTNRISEAALVGTTVFRVAATDRDTGVGGQIVYNLVDPSGTFSIDNSGNVVLQRSLDYEARQNYNITVTARDGGNVASSNNANLRIAVTEVNDNEPKFDVLYYFRTYPENTAINTGLFSVRATDGDRTGNVITYSIINNADSNRFSINPQNGLITLVGQLDYESQTRYTFTVRATDSGNQQLIGTAHVVIDVSDVNDNAPEFVSGQNDHSISILETTNIYTLLTVVSARDRDANSNGRVTYSISNGNETGKFTINQNGQIRLIGKLNAATQNKYTLTVNAKDAGSPSQSTDSTVTITVIPFNESVPQFGKNIYEIFVPENRRVGSILLPLDVTKTIPGSPVSVSFHSSTVFPEFSLNGFNLTLAQSLDFERQNKYNLIVVATDGENDKALTQIIVNVQNINEDPPVFNRAIYTKTISELAFIDHSVLEITATDKDGDNMFYNIITPVPDNAFRLQGNVVLVNRKLNVGTYQFNVSVADSTSRGSQATVIIEVIPENAPKFTNATYVVTVYEDHPVNQIIISTSAGPSNIGYVYTIESSDASRNFVINSIGQISLINPLNYEERKQYIFPIKATVSTPVPSSSAASVVVNVLNRNDVAPTFVNSPYNVNVSEAHLVGSSVLKITATDADKNSLTYSIVSGHNNQFMIQNDGSIILMGSLNYDLRDKYALNVSVSDGIFTTYTTANINVIPATKLPPKFNQTIYVTSVLENISPGSEILRVYTNNVIPPSVYQINEQSGKNFFTIDATGIIRTRQQLNYEANKQHIFTLEVQDKRNSGYATVVVNVLNVNDMCPTITPAVQTVQITEPVVADTIVAAVQTGDIDTSNLTLTLTGGNGLFKIDQYGGIKTTGFLDIATSTNYALTITVSDSVCPRTARVNVQVNPLAPCPDCDSYNFLQTLYERSIYENTVPTNPILSVATGQHLSTTYSIADTQALQYVTINSVTGQISVIRPFDYETIKRIEFDVMASGRTSQNRNPLEVITTKARVRITVLDLDDNCPVFSVPQNTEVSVSSPVQPNTFVARVDITDRDSFQNHTFTVNNPLFSIDSTGSIASNALIQSLTEQSYNLTIIVSDSNCAVTKYLLIRVTVCPKPMTYMFTSNGIYTKDVREDQNTVDTLLTVAIQGQYPRRFAIVEQEARNQFIIDPNTGAIRLRQSLDYEATQEHRFTVRADINGIFQSYATVIINVLNTNDVCPVFSQSSYNKDYTGTPAIGTIVAMLTASDADKTPLIYTITSGNNEGYFAINNNGDVTVNKKFPLSFNRNFPLGINAFDGICSATTTLNVRVTSCANPTDYQFTQSQYIYNLYENRTLGEFGIIDVKSGRSVRYLMPQISHFSLDSVTGALNLVRALDFETQQKYTFDVTANFSDGVVTTVPVEVNVLDVNDVCPKFSSQRYAVQHTEPLFNGVIVAYPEVNDADKTGTLAYSIVSGDSRFSINNKGQVYVNSKLETVTDLLSTTYSITVEVSDGNCSDRANIDVGVNKIVVGSYLFPEPFYQFSISENRAVPWIIDRFINFGGHKANYSIVGTSDYFIINRTSAVLTMVKPLDYEIAKRHYVRISAAFGGGIETYATVAVHVLDENDNAPRVYMQPPIARLTTNFPQNSLITTIVVEDVDTEQAFTYNIISGNDKGLFRVESSGLIKTTRCLTASDIGNHKPFIRVDDGVNAKQDVPVNILIYSVEDSSYDGSCGITGCPKNCGDPMLYMFSAGIYNATVQENSAIGTDIGSVSLSGGFGNATYRAFGSGSEYVNVDSNGKLTLARTLDYETKRTHQFTIEARIPAYCGDIIRSTAAYVINVGNVDDSAPVIVSEPATIRVSELSQIGHIIGCLKARDPDNLDAKLIFTLTSPNNTNAFTIDQNGEIKVNENLNAGLGQSFVLNYEVSDGTQSTNGSFNVFVIDSNDKVPKFTSNVYSVSVNENSVAGTPILTVTASDNDASPDNNKITYAIESSQPSGLFFINPSSGAISLNGTVDYETQQRHDVIVSATDNGGFKSIAVIRIRINDINDNSPTIISPTASNPGVTLHEFTAVGTPVFRILATDLDTSDTITYKIAGGSDYFNIDQNTGIITIKNNLYSSSDNQYILNLIAEDTAGNSQQRRLSLNVKRTSSNEFGCGSFITGGGSGGTGSGSGNSIRLPENTPVNTVIAVISSGIGGGLSNSIVYSLDSSSKSLFRISDNGNITLIARLDYEMSKNHVLKITADDKLRNISTRYNFYVDVLDVNEFEPAFTVSAIHVSELVPNGTYAGKITATDGDTSDVMTYYINGGDVNAFVINRETGVLTTNTNFDVSRQSTYRVEVCATDSSNVTCKNVTVNIDNANNNAPVFTNGINLTAILPSNNTVNDTVLQLNVNDADGDRLVYSLDFSGQDFDSYFGINTNTGVVYVKKQLMSGRYVFYVCAEDGVYKTCAPAIVTVASTTTTKPVFNPESYYAVLDVNTPSNTTLIRVRAIDPTSPYLKYEIVPGNNLFSIVGDTIKLSNPNGLVAGETISLNVVATNEQTMNMANTTVVIVVTDAQKTANLSYIAEVIGTTMIVNFSLATFDQNLVSYYYIIGQELPSDNSININLTTQLTPVSWFYANRLYQYRRYYVARINQSTLVGGRQRRSVNAVKTNSFTYRVGVEEGCNQRTGAFDICNGALKPGTFYRFSVEAHYSTGTVIDIPVIQRATTEKKTDTQLTRTATDGYSVVDSYVITFWIVGLVILGTLFWLAVLAIAILLCYKRRYRVDAAYGYSVGVRDQVDAPPRITDTNFYSIAQKETYTDKDTVKVKTVDDYNPKIIETQTHSMVILDSPEQTPEAQRKEYETRSASIKFIEEQPEWESMDIQLTIDPSGKHEPIITRKEHTEDVSGSPKDSDDSSSLGKPAETTQYDQPDYVTYHKVVDDDDSDDDLKTRQTITTTTTTTTYQTYEGEAETAPEQVRVFVEDDNAPADDTLTRL